MTPDKIESVFVKSIICKTHDIKIDGLDEIEIKKHTEKGCILIEDNLTGTDWQQDYLRRQKSENKLKNINLIKTVEKYLSTVIADDEPLTKRILRCGLSAYTNDPINLAILAPTSEGKTYTAVKVLEIFPEGDVIFIGRMSPAALIHDRGTLVDSKNHEIESELRSLRNELNAESDKGRKSEILEQIQKRYTDSRKLIDLTGKILLFLDSPNIELWDRLKPILSHDKKEIEFRIADKGKNGELRTSHVVIRGWPSCIFCSAKNEKRSPIWEEIETRFIITNPNMSVQKYRLANKLTGRKKGIPSFIQNYMQNGKEENLAKSCIEALKLKIQNLSKIGNPVWNPFIDIISEVFPNDQGITMRNFSRFTSFANIETLINSDSNLKLIFCPKGGEEITHIITSLQDIQNTITLMGIDSTIPEHKIKFVKDILNPIYLESSRIAVDTEQMAKKFKSVYNKPITPKKILENFLYPLRDYGIIDCKDDDEDRRKKIWYTVVDPETKSFDFIKSRIIEESNNDDLFVWSRLDELEKYSIPDGNVIVLDQNGNPIGFNLIQKSIISTDESNNFTEVYA